MNIELFYKKFLESRKISTDTREDILDSIFFAWKGEKINGNMFAKEALQKGAKYVVVDDKNFYIKEDKRYILVKDSITFLSELAIYHRSLFNIPVIAITGSNGKTTTKELVKAVLETEKNILATEGNLNNHVGVPKTLLKITEKTEIAVIEMGASHIGEINHLTNIAKPNYGIITNIGRAHIGLFGSFEGIIKTKTELYDFLRKNCGIVFVNKKDELLISKLNNIKKITYLSEDSNFPVYSEKTNPFVSLLWKNKKIEIKLTGEYNIPNIAAAIAVGNFFNISEKNIISGIEKYQPKNERSEIVESFSNTIVKDYYNANFSSMELVLENFSKIETEKTKITILGDMFELGKYTEEEHKKVIQKAISEKLKNIILVGENFYSLKDFFKNKKELTFLKNIEDCILKIEKEKWENNYILLKSSQGMQFVKIFNVLSKKNN